MPTVISPPTLASVGQAGRRDLQHVQGVNFIRRVRHQRHRIDRQNIGRLDDVIWQRDLLQLPRRIWAGRHRGPGNGRIRRGT